MFGWQVKNTVEESIYKLNRNRSTSSFISGNKKNQDQPVLTLKDVESLLFTTKPPIVSESDERPSESLMHLPPSVAAVMAAERRLKEHAEKSSWSLCYNFCCYFCKDALKEHAISNRRLVVGMIEAVIEMIVRNWSTMNCNVRLH